ncbi:hypothetical protein AWN88_03955 [Agrobacterium tumefaciens]|nr:hypothetical protein AWN88_03955 [Agrobacterium tumefaciens]KAJ35505.1 hypothetical protein BW45_28150 [Agrobacterium tumefaciens]
MKSDASSTLTSTPFSVTETDVSGREDNGISIIIIPQQIVHRCCAPSGYIELVRTILIIEN